jgi:hypothetical protein
LKTTAKLCMENKIEWFLVSPLTLQEHKRSKKNKKNAKALNGTKLWGEGGNNLSTSLENFFCSCLLLSVRFILFHVVEGIFCNVFFSGGADMEIICKLCQNCRCDKEKFRYKRD